MLYKTKYVHGTKRERQARVKKIRTGTKEDTWWSILPQQKQISKYETLDATRYNSKSLSTSIMWELSQ